MGVRSLVAALTVLIALALPRPARAGEKQPAPARFDTVVLDAGHGGDDHGAEGPGGLLEKDVVLDVTRRAAARLRALGLRVVLTRDADRFVALDERTRRANESGADLFVSIHANAAGFRGARGIETFFASPEATDEAAHELANSENLAFGPAAAQIAQGDPVLAILGDLLANEHLRDSQEFARIAQRRVATAEAARSRGVKQAPFVVLMGVRMPAVLIEIGFLTNPHDEKALRREEERERLAEALAGAVGTFRERQNARLGAVAATPAEGGR